MACARAERAQYYDIAHDGLRLAPQSARCGGLGGKSLMLTIREDAMAFIPTPNAVRASLEFLFGGQVVVLTLGWHKATGWDAAGMEDLGDALVDWMDAALKFHMANDVSLESINVLDLEDAAGPSINVSAGLPITGTNANLPAPNNVAAVVSFLTDLRGRSYRGRNYVPGIPEPSWQDSTAITTAAAAALAAAYADLEDVATATGAEHVVVSKFHNNAPRVAGVATPVTAYRVDTKLDSQRRRLSGRGI